MFVKEKKARRVITKKLLLRSIASMLLVVSIPLLTCVYVYQSFSRDTLEAKERMLNRQYIQTIQENFDSLVMQFIKVGVTLNTNYSFFADNMNSVALHHHIIETLSNYNNILGTSNLFFAIQSDPHLFTAYGTYYIPFYESNTIKQKAINAANITYEKALRITSTAQGDVILNSDEDTIEVIYPLYYGKAFIGFQLPWKELFPGAWDSDLIAMLIGSQGKLLYTSDKAVSDALLAQGASLSVLDQQSCQIGDTRYDCQLLVNGNSGTQLLFLASNRRFISEIKTLDTSFMLVLTLVLAISSVLIAIVNHLNYQPIHRLRQHVASLSDEDVQYKNELDYVEQAFAQLHRNFSDVQRQKNAHEEQILVSQLARQPAEPELLDACREVGITVPAVTMFFAIVRIYEDSKLQQQLLRNECLQRLQPYVTGWSAPYHENHGYILLLCSQQDVSAQTIADELSAMCTEKTIPMYIGLSQPVHQAEDLQDAYIQARGALTACRSHDKRPTCVAYTGEFLAEAQSDATVEMDIDGLFNAITSSNLSQSRILLDRLIHYICSESTLPLRVCYATVNAILRAGKQNALIAAALQSSPVDFSHLEFVDASDFVVFVNDLFDIISVQFHSSNDCFGDCCVLIQQHLLNPVLSPEFVADEMHISVSALTRTFQAHANVTPSAYILKMKQEYAKQQLISTDVTVSTLATQLGYSQASSFIRTFKREEGVTPGEFRLQYQEGFRK